MKSKCNHCQGDCPSQSTICDPCRCVDCRRIKALCECKDGLKDDQKRVVVDSQKFPDISRPDDEAAT